MKNLKPVLLQHWALTVILSFWLVLLICAVGHADQKFPQTYQSMALQVDELPAVVPTHPRLFVRKDPWSHGPSLVELKQWSLQGSFNAYLNAKPWNNKPGLEWAFRYLVTEDESLVEPIVQRLKNLKNYWPGYLTRLATNYDWLYNSPNFKDEDKRLIEDKIISWGFAAIRKGEEYHDMWSHFGYRPVTDLAAAGLALYGHRDEAKVFLAMAGGCLKKNFLPGWQLNEGAWQGGWTYYGQGASNLMTLIHLWSAGTDENLYALIAAEQNDWLRKHIHFLFSAIYEDGSPMETGGFNYAPSIEGLFQGALPATYAYQDPSGIAYFSSLRRLNWRAGIWQFIFYSPKMREHNVEEPTMPLSRLWGRDGVGYVQMRSGWGEGDTLIDFKCGDYFWSHQFNNQNAFTIYRGGKLAVQSGIYRGYWGAHMLFYYRATVGANAMLVIQPDETTWVPPSRANDNRIPNDGGYFSVFGGQRSCFMHPVYGTAENCFSFEKYLYRKENEHHFETGTMQGWEVGDRYTYASGDATMAYNNPRYTYPKNTPKVDHVSRDLVFLDRTYLVVFDRVNALKPEYEKRWLLHTVGKPQLAMEKIHEEVPGHITTYPSGRVRVDNGDGTLFVETIFPEESTLRVVGGTPMLTDVRPDPGNRGNAMLETEVTGRYAGMGGSIATDAAKPEKWIIEFISDDEFSVSGSGSGADGKGKVGELFFSESYSLLIPGKNWRGKPQKGDRFTFDTTSTSYRFWVNGKSNLFNVKGMVKVFKEGSRVDPGNWRIEVSPVDKRRYDSFLHLLTPMDRSAANAPHAVGIRSEDESLTGVAVADWAVMFVELKGLGKNTSYRVAGGKGAISHLVLGVEKDTPHEVVFSRADGKVLEKRALRSSAEGTLLFTADSSVSVALRAVR